MIIITPMASGPFFSLNNTDFVVLLGFIIFIGVLLYFKVPAMVTGLLDKRSEAISKELDEARALREEAQSLLASFERKQKEVEDQAASIVSAAKAEAEAAAAQAKDDLTKAMERRLQAASDQIASAEQSAVREVKDRAVSVAVAAAAEVMKKNISAGTSGKLIDDAIGQMTSKLH